MPWVWPTLAVTVTTRTITFLVGDLYQPLFTFTFHYWEGHPKSFVGHHQGGWIGYYLHHAVHPVQLPETSWFMILLYFNWISTFWLGLQSPKLSKTYLACEKWLEENDVFLWHNFFRGNQKTWTSLHQSFVRANWWQNGARSLICTVENFKNLRKLREKHAQHKNLELKI